MLSNLLVIAVVIINSSTHQKLYALMTCTWIAVGLFQFVTQISLILIFLEIGKKNPLKEFEQARYSTDATRSRYQTVKFDYKEEEDVLIHFAEGERDNSLLNDT